MIKQALKNWLFKAELEEQQRQLEAAEKVKREQEDKEAQLKALELKQKETEEAAKKLIADERKTIEESSEPWVEIKSNEHDPVEGIKLELDWNPAFVKYLRDNGYTGVSDESIVGKWLTTMYAQVAEDLRGDNRFE